MQTPRFSGQPSSAGDFVFVRIFSRPLRTSCANVGTQFPPLGGSSFRWSWIKLIRPDRGDRTDRDPQAPEGNYLGAPRRRQAYLVPISICLSGEDYTALRGWRPITAAPQPPFLRPLFRGSRTLRIFTTRDQTTPEQPRKYRKIRCCCQHAQMIFAGQDTLCPKPKRQKVPPRAIPRGCRRGNLLFRFPWRPLTRPIYLITEDLHKH